MTTGTLSRRLALLASLVGVVLAAACGGMDDPKDKKANADQANLRAINLSTDVASVDVYTGDTRRFSSLGSDAVSADAVLDAVSTTLGIRSAGQTATLFSESFTPAKGSAYLTVVAGRESSLVVRTIGESEDTASITAGNFRLRVLNLVSDASAVDVYVVPAAAGITGDAPFRFTTASLSDFQTFSSATPHRLLVTGPGNVQDVRLDITLTGVVDKQFHTLVIVSGANGALLNASLIAQRATATTLKNTHARVRLAAGADGNGNVSATVAGASIGGVLRSPNVSPYKLVDAGTRTLAVSLGGSVVETSPRVFTAGKDYTVLAFGSSGAPRVRFLEDDNRAPGVATQAKIRLVNAVDGSQPMTLRADFQSIVTNIDSGAASAYAVVTGATSSRVEVTTAGAAALFTLTSSGGQPLLLAQGVYTLFMLGGNASPSGELSKDR